jgi:DNA-binding XRE family transcriptional regulator
MRYRDENGQDWADIIDFLTMYPDSRPRVVQVLGEIEAAKPTLAAYPGMMQRARRREGLRVCHAAWLVGVSVREYREIEAEESMPSLGTYERICKLYGWAQTFIESRT